jgi:phosphate/phosphite/phosphonate ABC transporter binding protein
MSRKVLATMAFLVILTTLISCGTTPAAPPELTASPTAVPAAMKRIVLGATSSEPAKKIKSFQPLADYLAAHLGQFGIGVGEVKIAPDIDSMVPLLKAGEVDLSFESPYPSMIETDKANAQPILRRWKGGYALYDTVLFVQRSSGITSLQGLNGHMIGYEDRFSTSGYFMPTTYLLTAGIHPVEKSGPNAAVATDEVGYVFTKNSVNTIQWVLSGKVTAGAVDNPTFLTIPQESRAALTVLGQTEPVARHLVLARAGMDPALLAAIKDLLINLDKTPEGQAVLKSFENTKKFDEFATAAELARIRELYTLIQAK